MPRTSDEGSWSRRKSFFALGALSSSKEDGSAKQKKILKKTSKRHHRMSSSSSILTDISHHSGSSTSRENNGTDPSAGPSASPRPSRLESLPKLPRSSSKLDRLRALRPSTENLAIDDDDDYEPLSAVSTEAPSFSFPESPMEGFSQAKTVIQHGEVQTSAGMFRKKKEYLVLTDTHLFRYKAQAKAAEAFKAIPTSNGGRPANVKHGSMPSVGSQSSVSDVQTQSDSSGDKHGRVPLRLVVAVHRPDDSRPYFPLEVSYMDEESSNSSSMTLQFGNPDERDSWLRNIRTAVQELRTKQPGRISNANIQNVVRTVERDYDYDPANCSIYKIVLRQQNSKTSNKNSSDDLTKVGSTVCFLAIGVHKVHIMQFGRSAVRSPMTALQQNNTHASYGILTLVGLKVSGNDDSLDLMFRPPMQNIKHVSLASAAAPEIAARLHLAENFLRPECGHRLFRFSAPAEVERLLAPAVVSDEEHCCLDRTLAAYCVAYGTIPTNVRYTINYNCEDAPRFELLPPADTRRSDYTPLELLAIMRALRYNESFGSITFAGVLLDSLNGLHDNHGTEYVCAHTKRGTPIRLTSQELSRSNLLVQEVRALAATSKKLRRMDFSGCITGKAPMSAGGTEDEAQKSKDIGCGVVEALFPLCRHQTTNVDWICLNGIYLTETDLDYLVGAAVEKSCHFRAIELNRCGLHDRTLGLILDALRAQENTLEALKIAGNTARINPVAFDGQLSMFGFIRVLDLSNVSRTSGSEPIITAETLLIWRLQELKLSGLPLNAASIDAISTYLAHPQSRSLHELYVDNAFLSGSDIATLLHSMTQNPGETRDLLLDISQNHLGKDLDKVTKAIAKGFGPSRLTMRAIEYKEENAFRKMLTALTSNKSIRSLDMSQTALPGDASEETCKAMERLLAENESLVELDLSGEDSRLATSKFGPGLNQALSGLKHNKSIQLLRIEKQKLGLQGSSTLAEVLKENSTLRELHCDNNEIPLHGLTDLVNSLIDNTSLIYLPTMDDGRAAAFKTAEVTMKGLTDFELAPSPPPPKHSALNGASVMKRGLANVKRSAARSAQFTPSFPALPKSSPSTSSRPSHVPLPRDRNAPHSPLATSFTVQDIQTTQRLLTEQWDRQCFRLGQYLDRNWCLLHNMPVTMEIEDEKFERPESAGSLGRMLEQVKHDTTPRVEKALYFDSPLDGSATVDVETPRKKSVGTVTGAESDVSFKHFLLDTTQHTPESLSDAFGRSLGLESSASEVDSPRTPTQSRGFS